MNITFQRAFYQLNGLRKNEKKFKKDKMSKAVATHFKQTVLMFQLEFTPFL